MRVLFILILAFFFFSTEAQENSKKIEWLTFTEAIERNKTEPRKIIIDIYTSWCGWCKRMDATTFKNPEIVSYINEKYYPVKLDAERKDSVFINNHWFINQKPEGRRNPHDLAISLLEGKMTYPSTVLMDENINLMHKPIAGYLDAKTLEPILRFFGENIHLTKAQSWEEFKKEFEEEEIVE